MGAIERFLDWLMSMGTKALPFDIVPVAQAGGVLRFGKYHRTVAPGFVWKWPFVEEVRKHDVALTTLRLEPQTLTTKDRQTIVIAAIVKYAIRDIKPYITEIWDARDVLADVAMGAVRQAVVETTFEELIDNPPERAVLEAVRKQVNKFGFQVHAVTCTDLAKMRSFRLLTHAPVNIDN